MAHNILVFLHISKKMCLEMCIITEQAMKIQIILYLFYLTVFFCFIISQFHGKGKIIFPCGSIINGTCINGNSKDLSMTFSDGLKYETDDWIYCNKKDRRLKECRFFGITHFKKYNENLIDIPKNCYDTGEGFYNSNTGTLLDYKTNEVLSIPTKSEQDWIKKNCRKSSIEDLCEFISRKKPALKRKLERRKSITTKSI